jgi:ribosome biogenesis GTPase A
MVLSKVISFRWFSQTTRIHKYATKK